MGLNESLTTFGITRIQEQEILGRKILEKKKFLIKIFEKKILGREFWREHTLAQNTGKKKCWTRNSYKKMFWPKLWKSKKSMHFRKKSSSGLKTLEKKFQYR